MISLLKASAILLEKFGHWILKKHCESILITLTGSIQ